jgi:hypothetical protein
MHDLNAALTTTVPFLTLSTGLRDVNDRTLGDWYFTPSIRGRSLILASFSRSERRVFSELIGVG